MVAVHVEVIQCQCKGGINTGTYIEWQNMMQGKKSSLLINNLSDNNLIDISLQCN